MVYLYWRRSDSDSSKFVRAPYNSLGEAKAQADHNIETNSQRPLRIEDESGAVLVNYEG
jgi:hypothetical protein